MKDTYTHRGLPIFSDAIQAAHAFVGRKVRIYRNLSKRFVIENRAVYSIQDAETGLVIGYAESINLGVVEFTVSEAGRQRVLRERVKNVHAFVTGFVVMPPAWAVNSKRASYNPYKTETFMVQDKSLLPLRGAQFAYLGQCGVRVFGALWTPVAE